MSEELPEVGPWAREKLGGLRAYLSAYMKILSKQRSLRTVYVDAFAAAGRAVVRKSEQDDPTLHLDLGDVALDVDAREVIDGSPRVALEIEPPFDQYVFIEADDQRLAELKALEEEYAGRRKIAVRAGDCNKYLTTTLLKVLASDRRWRGVVFLDPFGMHVPWSTIKELADSKQVEVFINFPVGMAIQRLLLRSAQLTHKARLKLDSYSVRTRLGRESPATCSGQQGPREWPGDMHMNPSPTKRISLTAVGDELALVLDQETLAAVGYTIDTVVDVRVEGGSIVIEPVRDAEEGGQPPPPARPPGA